MLGFFLVFVGKDDYLVVFSIDFHITRQIFAILTIFFPQSSLLFFCPLTHYSPYYKNKSGFVNLNFTKTNRNSISLRTYAVPKGFFFRHIKFSVLPALFIPVCDDFFSIWILVSKKAFIVFCRPS